MRKFKKFLQIYAPDLTFPLLEDDWMMYVAFLECDEKLKPGTIGQYLLHMNKLFACLNMPAPKFKEMPRLRVLHARVKGLKIAKGKKKHPVHF